ncbi:MAG TPA: DUF3987 domain-containing protein, partial [Dehalococcoidia bacterium]|nr:DUF3987 domain-containing protein [Dehalococcoidia bacterium]
KVWWESLDGSNNLGGRPPETLPFYGAEHLANLPDEAVVVTTEGEPAAKALRGQGIAAVGTVTGSGSIPCDDVLRHLVRLSPAPWPDNADDGRRHMDRIAARLVDLGCQSVRLIDWPDAPPKGDAADAVAQGVDIQALIESASPWTPQEDGGPEIQWEPPQPFDLVSVPEFPVDALPGDVARYVSQESEAKQVPVDLPATLAIGGVATAVAGKCNVVITPDWQEPLNIYVADVLPSGERKSPEFRSVLKPIEDVEREVVQEQIPEIQKAKTERDILEQRLKNAKSEAARAKPDDCISAEAEVRAYTEQLALFEVPVPTRLLADDATPEAVAGLLAEQKGRLAIASTEGGIFDIVGGRYSDSTPNLDVYLKGYSGDTIRVDRRSRPPEFVPNPALTIILTVQPDVIRDLASKKAFRGRGFLARWLYSLPRSWVGYRNIDALSVPEESRRMWDFVLRAMLSLPIPKAGEAPSMHLSLGAHALLRTFRQEVELELRPGEELDDLADWGNKLPGNVARLAGLLHISKWAMDKVYRADKMDRSAPWDSEIAPETMEAAIRLGRYFEGHAKAAFALMGSDGELAIAKKLWAVIQRHNAQTFTLRDLWQKVRRQFTNVSGLESALNTLGELGYVRRLETPKPEGRGKAPSPMFLVNPLARPSETPRTPNNGHRPDLEVF